MNKMLAGVCFRMSRALVQGGVFSLALLVAAAVSARSITDIGFTTSGDETTVNVVFEAGEPGDCHALYVAGAMTDQGTSITDWTSFQRIGSVAENATAASFKLSAGLKSVGSIFRVFLVEDQLPYDTRIEAIQQTGTQYLDTGIAAGPTTFVALDFEFASNTPTQQRVFGIASDDGTSLFSFDTYINGGGNWASACKDGSGDWSATTWGVVPRARLTISLDAATGIHALSNHTTHATTSITHTGARTATACGAITIFARRSFKNSVEEIHLFANGGLIYGGVISNEGALVRNYLPCKRGGRAGLYETVSDTITWSAVANDDFTDGGESIVCQPATNETQVAVSDPIDLDTRGPARSGRARSTATGTPSTPTGWPTD